MTRPVLRTLSMAALWWLVLGCGDPPLLELKIVTPQGPDPLATADSVRLVVSNPPSEMTYPISGSQGFSLDLDLDVNSEVGTITLEALANGVMKARGETPPLMMRSQEQQLSILVAPAGALSLLRPKMTQPGKSMTSVLLPGAGILLAGGLDPSGKGLSSVEVYDFFDHVLRSVADLPESRAGAVGAYCGSTCGIIALGWDAKALAQHILSFDGSTWVKFADGLDPATRRRDASLASLGDGTYLVAGGVDVAGTARSTLLILNPGTVNDPPTLKALSRSAVAARLRPAMAAGTGAVVIAGGQATGQSPCEVFYKASLSNKAVTLPGQTLASGAAAVDVGDGRVAIIGGRDPLGKLLTDAWIVDPTNPDKVVRVEKSLAAGRAGHQAIRLGSHIVVLGGTSAAGLATTAEVLDAATLTPLKGLKKAMKVPRSGALAVHLGPTSVLVAGGSDASGAAVQALEVYQTSVQRPPAVQ